MSRISSRQNAEVKMGSRLEISDWGTPWSQTMSLKNACASDSRLHRVWMSERDEVAVLTETIDHRQDDRFAPNARQCLHEIQAEIIPDSRRNWQRQQESGWMKMLGLVALARRTGVDVVLDGASQVGRMEIPTKAVQCALHSFMAVLMYSGHELGQQREL